VITGKGDVHEGQAKYDMSFRLSFESLIKVMLSNMYQIILLPEQTVYSLR